MPDSYHHGLRDRHSGTAATARRRSGSSDAREDILASFQGDYEPVQADEIACRVHVDTTQTLDDCVSQALADMRQQQP